MGIYNGTKVSHVRLDIVMTLLHLQSIILEIEFINYNPYMY